MRTKLAIPISAPDTGSAAKQIERAKNVGAEIIELRTDYLEDLSTDTVGELISCVHSDNSLPIIVTCRSSEQGGASERSDRLRLEILTSALNCGADLVDIEFDTYSSPGAADKINWALDKNPAGRLIISHHNFDSPFDDLQQLHRRIRDARPDAICKLVYKANHINDCFEAFDLLGQTDTDSIVFCMGRAGMISRVLAAKLGSFLTFASLDAKSATAPGQLTAQQLKDLYHFDSINPDTKVYGVIGSPVAHSISPAIHNTCFAQINANALYLPILLRGDSEQFDRFIDSLRTRPWLDFAGFSVTIPHKLNALNYVRDKNGYVEPLAEKIGAVNTLLLDPDGETKAYNTDYTGALEAIIAAMNISKQQLKDLPAAVIGAGGVARALIAGLTDAGAKLTIYNRTVEKAEKLAADFNCAYAGLDQLENLQAKLVCNCTSLGMTPNTDTTPLNQEYINSEMTIFDTVYNPPDTLLLKQARAAGATGIDGLTMFINQARAQFTLFTGQSASAELMRKTVKKYLSK